jgi:hypothetical protein
MFANRISALFPQGPFAASDQFPAPSAPQQILPRVSLPEIYQAAASRAERDHELDRLFNPDYYGDHGSGI